MSLLRLLGLTTGPATEPDLEVDSIRKISRELEQMEPAQSRYLAAFAYLLGRVAHADLEISDVEANVMEQIIADKGRLSIQQAVMIIEIAKHQNRLFGHVDNFLVTRQFNEIASQQQKLELLDCLFAVCAADESVSTAEDSEIRQISSELLLDRKAFIQIRSRYRSFLDVLKKPDSISSDT